MTPTTGPRLCPAPCGCNRRDAHIRRELRILHPTVWLDCRCDVHKATWTDRYEFDFSVPLGGKTWEDAPGDSSDSD